MNPAVAAAGAEAAKNIKGKHLLIGGAVILGVGTLAWFGIYRPFLVNRGILQDKKPFRQLTREWGRENSANSWNADTRQRLSDAQIQSMANKIHTSMHGCNTWEDEIIAEFKKLKTDGDFAALQAAYGSRPVTCMGIGGSYDLTTALTTEMSTYWTDKINSILKSKGIKYRV